MSDLEYEFHQMQHKALLQSPNAETRAAAEVRALEDHQLSVRVEIQKYTEEVLITAQAKAKNESAQRYLRYGVGRRLRMIWTSYVGVFDTIAADRREPLPTKETAAASRDLNVIYINLRGALDNYAWAIFHEHELGKKGKFNSTEIGLFVKKFRDAIGRKKLTTMLEKNDDWHTDMKSRRDPAAHRIPLFVSPAILNEAQGKRFQEIWGERIDAIKKGDYERATKLVEEQNSLGTFTPHFFHDTGEGVPIYRTVPNDVGKLIEIGRAIHQQLFA